MRLIRLLLLACPLALGCTEPGQTEIAKGNVFASKGELDKAIEAYKAASAAAPTKARPHELIGHVYFDQKKYEKARAAYETALRIEPQVAIEAKIGLARIAADEARGDEKKLDEAIERLTDVLKTQPQNVYALLSRANLYMRRAKEGDLDGAIEDTAKAMAIDERNASVLYTRGCAFLAKKDPKGARELFEKLAKTHPASPLAPYGLARVAAFEGKVTDALLLLREAKEKGEGKKGWNPDEVREDTAFRAMKDNEQFKQLLGG